LLGNSPTRAKWTSHFTNLNLNINLNRKKGQLNKIILIHALWNVHLYKHIIFGIGCGRLIVPERGYGTTSECAIYLAIS
jgi:hypothetical protein